MNRELLRFLSARDIGEMSYTCAHARYAIPWEELLRERFPQYVKAMRSIGATEYCARESLLMLEERAIKSCAKMHRARLMIALGDAEKHAPFCISVAGIPDKILCLLSDARSFAPASALWMSNCPILRGDMIIDDYGQTRREFFVFDGMIAHHCDTLADCWSIITIIPRVLRIGDEFDCGYFSPIIGRYERFAAFLDTNRANYSPQRLGPKYNTFSCYEFTSCKKRYTLMCNIHTGIDDILAHAKDHSVRFFQDDDPTLYFL